MNHPIHKVLSFQQTGPYQLRIGFEDELSREIDFKPIFAGDLYEPLLDPNVFSQVRLDPEVHTLVWPNDADFDPAMLHDWPEHEAEFCAWADRWKKANAPDNRFAERRCERLFLAQASLRDANP